MVKELNGLVRLMGVNKSQVKGKGKNRSILLIHRIHSVQSQV
jgi:hypothetical protein